MALPDCSALYHLLRFKLHPSGHTTPPQSSGGLHPPDRVHAQYRCLRREIIRGAIPATPRGEISPTVACSHDTPHYLAKRTAPGVTPTGNEVIFMLHASAIASTVTILDLDRSGVWHLLHFTRRLKPSFCGAYLSQPDIHDHWRLPFNWKIRLMRHFNRSLRHLCSYWLPALPLLKPRIPSQHFCGGLETPCRWSSGIKRSAGWRKAF